MSYNNNINEDQINEDQISEDQINEEIERTKTCCPIIILMCIFSCII